MEVACEYCLRRSLLKAQSLRIAEGSDASRFKAAELLKLNDDELANRLRVTAPDVLMAIDSDLAELAESGDSFWSTCRHREGFPSELLQLTDCPPVIYGIGEANLLAPDDNAPPRVAIVGSRRASAYGRDVAFSLGSDVSAAGLPVVSGMALGIDGAAHRGALRSSGPTIAVLAGGPDVAYPRSHRLLHEQIAEGGAVVSENPPGIVAQRWSFVGRNRIIAALATITVIVEGTMESGARHTVEYALQIGRSVGAVPGPVTSPMSAKPNQYLREGAELIRDAGDVLDVLMLDGSQRPLAPELQLGEDAKVVLEKVRAGASDPRAIAEELPELEARDVVRALGTLELDGLVQRDSRGAYSPTIR